jgi:AcrR family transcriptional regulator
MALRKQGLDPMIKYAAVVDQGPSRRTAIVEAARELLVDGGPSALTIDALIDRSGVARATVYRHWSSMRDLFVEVMDTSAPEPREPIPGDDLGKALKATMRAAAENLNDPVWTHLVATLALYRNLDDDLRALDDRLTKQRIRVLSALLDEGVHRRLISADIDMREAACFLWGPIHFVHLTRTMPLNDELADEVVASFLASYAPGAVAQAPLHPALSSDAERSIAEREPDPPSRIPSVPVRGRRGPKNDQLMDPRTRRARAAAIQAATNLLIEGGLRALSIDAVASRSGIAKSTIYRQWPSREQILHAVIDTHAPRVPAPDPSLDVISMLRVTIRSIASALRDPTWGRLIPAVLLLRRHDPNVSAIDTRLHSERRVVLQSLIERAAHDRIVNPGIEPTHAEAQLLGPLLFAHLTQTVDTDDAFADQIVQRFIAAYDRVL